MTASCLCVFGGLSRGVTYLNDTECMDLNDTESIHTFGIVYAYLRRCGVYLMWINVVSTFKFLFSAPSAAIARVIQSFNINIHQMVKNHRLQANKQAGAGHKL